MKQAFVHKHRNSRCYAADSPNFSKKKNVSVNAIDIESRRMNKDRYAPLRAAIDRLAGHAQDSGV